MIPSSEQPLLGQQLQHGRLQRGLSLGALALQSGVHKSTLSRWERGIQLPSMRELDLVLKALEVSVQEATTLRRQLERPRAVLYQHQETPGLRQISGGELLRTLRFRSGATQGDAARVVGVTREMLSRWERGERWPDTQKLHTLCYHLGASLDETLHLTTRGFIEEEPLPLDRQRLLGIHASFAFESVLAPGHALSTWYLAACLAELEKNNTNRLQLDQAAIWGALGYRLWQAGSFHTARSLGEQTDRLMRACHRWLGSSQMRGILVRAEAEARQYGPRAAIRYLESWHDQIDEPELRAWIYSVEADYLLRGGEQGESLQRSQDSLTEVTAQGNASRECHYRLRDHARRLLLAQQMGSALECLQSLQEKTAFSERENAPTLLLLSYALLATGQSLEASRYREQAHTLLGKYQILLPQEYQDF